MNSASSAYEIFTVVEGFHVKIKIVGNRSFNSVLADWNDLSPTTKKLSFRDFKNVLRKTFM